ncbi:hypothetical protein D3C71_1466990 [compost metagenome]
MAVVHRVKTNQRGEQTNVRFGQELAGQITVGVQHLLQMIQLRKHIFERFFISLL